MGGLFAAAARLRRARWAASLCSCHARAPPLPLQEKDEYVENIIADMKRLGLPCDAITYTSDYFPQLKDCGERLIKAGEWRHQCPVCTPHVFRRTCTHSTAHRMCCCAGGEMCPDLWLAHCALASPANLQATCTLTTPRWSRCARSAWWAPSLAAATAGAAAVEQRQRYWSRRHAWPALAL